MKKVLLIAYQFPPRSAIGAQRPYGLARHLPKYGWEPIVLTANLPGKPPEGIKIIETDYKDVTNKIKSIIGFNPKKTMHDQLGIAVDKNHNLSIWKSNIIKLCKEIILFPDDQKGWNSYAYRAASQLMDTQKIDAIISTSPPVTSHLIARKLRQKYDVKWIADFRDPWSQKYINNKTSLMKYLERCQEIKTISYADILVSVTKPYVDKINKLHKDKEIFCITNGFDDEAFKEPVPELTSKFTITYTGYLYNGKRDPSILFTVVDQLIKENKIDRDLVEIRFYGPKEDWLINDVNKYNLNGVVSLNGVLPKDKILIIQRESQLLLLIRWDSKMEIGDCPAKIYEYMDSKRPIIAIGGHGGIIKELLEETNTGRFAENPEVLKELILKHYQEYIQYGKVKCKSNDKVNNYNYNYIAKQYSAILDNVIIN